MYICRTRGDGACGAHCVASNFYHDETLGHYVRRNVNDHIVDFWPFYEPFVKFPWMDHHDLQAVSNMYQVPVHILTTGVGMVEPKARWTHLEPDIRLESFRSKLGELPELWILHSDNIHFDLLIRKDSKLAKEGSINQRQSKNEDSDNIPIDREEEEESDSSLNDKKEEEIDLTEDNNDQKKRPQSNQKEEEVTNSREENSGKDPQNDKNEREEINLAEEGSAKKNEITAGGKEEEEADLTKGPGYMGWEVDEENKKPQNKQKFQSKLEELKIYYDQLKSDFNELKEEFHNVSKKLEDKSDMKNIAKLHKEMKSLKTEYKECIDALRKETHERTKAETTTKVLKDIINSQEKILENKKEMNDSDSCEEMEVDESMGVWINQQKRKSIKISKRSNKCHSCKVCKVAFQDKNELLRHEQTHRQNIVYGCKKCANYFEEKDELTEHEKTHSEDLHSNVENCEKSCKDQSKLNNHEGVHSQNISYMCDKCEKSFNDESDLENHAEVHNQNVPYKCDKCDGIFNENDELRQHIMTVHDQNKEITKSVCTKCDKVYSDMNKLRRHDWRSHREIECNICGVTLQSRQEITDHRRSQHKMYRKIKCSFYPDCVDENECFFLHEDEVSGLNQAGEQRRSRYCPPGEQCQNQSCEYSERNHINMNNIMCKFQSKCNRSECLFKHVMEKASFLGDCMKNSKRK